MRLHFWGPRRRSTSNSRIKTRRLECAGKPERQKGSDIGLGLSGVERSDSSPPSIARVVDCKLRRLILNRRNGTVGSRAVIVLMTHGLDAAIN
jgi:hypothetical protein